MSGELLLRSVFPMCSFQLSLILNVAQSLDSGYQTSLSHTHFSRFLCRRSIRQVTND